MQHNTPHKRFICVRPAHTHTHTAGRVLARYNPLNAPGGCVRAGRGPKKMHKNSHTYTRKGGGEGGKQGGERGERPVCVFLPETRVVYLCLFIIYIHIAGER